MAYFDLFLTIFVCSCLAAIATVSVIGILRNDYDLILCGIIAVVGCISVFYRIPVGLGLYATISVSTTVLLTAYISRK